MKVDTVPRFVLGLWDNLTFLRAYLILILSRSAVPDFLILYIYQNHNTLDIRSSFVSSERANASGVGE